MRTKQKSLKAVLVIFLVCLMLPLSMANSLLAFAEKGEAIVTIAGEYIDDRVLVTLTQSASIEPYEYLAEDFAEYGCIGVTDLMPYKTQKVLDSVEKQSNTMKLCEKSYCYEFCSEDEIYDFRRILSLDISGISVAEAILELQKCDIVEDVSPDYVIEACSSTPDDTCYSSQWAADVIDLPEAWEVTTGSSEIIVGVIDSGIDVSHEDLNNVVDDDLSCSFINGYDSLEDSNGHGTHVAGIIGAKGNNNIGIAGISWDVTLVSLRVFDDKGFGSDSSVASAVDYAESKNINILNFSGGSALNSSVLYSSINNYSGLFVCAAGNSNVDNDKAEVYPANYDLDNIIAVGASAEADTKCSFSNYGKSTVDLFAPGNNIYSCYTDGGYAYLSGTSMATPQVTGVAALLLSIHSNLTAGELKSIILESVDDVDAFADLCVSGGRLNAYKAVQLVHKMLYLSNNVFNHTATCTKCGYSYTEEHDWTEYATYFRCSKCLYKSKIIPVIISSLSDSEKTIIEFMMLSENSIPASKTCEYENAYLCYYEGMYYYVKSDSAQEALNLIKSVLKTELI